MKKHLTILMCSLGLSGCITVNNPVPPSAEIAALRAELERLKQQQSAEPSEVPFEKKYTYQERKEAALSAVTCAVALGYTEALFETAGQWEEKDEARRRMEWFAKVAYSMGVEEAVVEAMVEKAVGVIADMTIEDMADTFGPACNELYQP